MRVYYERGVEADRLDGGMESGPLEFDRTKELIGRFLPERSLDVLDVGGGPGDTQRGLPTRVNRGEILSSPGAIRFLSPTRELHVAPTR